MLKNKVDQLEEKNSKTNVEISDGNNKLRNEIKKLFCLVNDMGQKKDEQEKEILKMKAENEEIIEDQDSVAEVVKCNGDGSAPERCVFKDCGMAFTADTRKHAYGIKHTHEEDHIHRFKDPKKYFEKFKLEIATWDCNAEIFMSD